ncbi:MAG: hypothetical protein ACJAYU_001552 [Bradymonadia bacterium]
MGQGIDDNDAVRVVPEEHSIVQRIDGDMIPLVVGGHLKVLALNTVPRMGVG